MCFEDWNMVWHCPYPARSSSSLKLVGRVSSHPACFTSCCLSACKDLSKDLPLFLDHRDCHCVFLIWYEADFGLWHEKQLDYCYGDLLSIGKKELVTVTQPVCDSAHAYWGVLYRWWRDIMHSNACTCFFSHSLYNNSRTTSLQSRHRCRLSQGRSWVYWRPHKFSPQPGMSWHPEVLQMVVYTQSLFCLTKMHGYYHALAQPILRNADCPAHWWDLH